MNKKPVQKESLRNKPKGDMPLHKFIALGGKPKDYVGCKGVSHETVTNVPRKNYK